MSKKTPVASPVPTGDSKTEASTARRVVVILGSGRSGTSLCAKILSRLGIAMEATLQRPNEMNPEGYFEDARLVEINKRLLEKLAPVLGAAPDTDVEAARIEPEMRELRAHLRERTSAGSEIWGFKDPRVSILLPLYRRIFQDEGIVPHYIFCARSANSVVESLLQTGIKSREVCEQIYFTRSFMALRDCGANCYVLHYEKLLELPGTQIRKLWAYLNTNGTDFPLSDAEIEGLVSKNFNRSSLRASSISNPLAARMSKIIDSMEGSDFDRDFVFQEIQDIDAINAGYQTCINRMVNLLGNMRNKIKKLEEERKSNGRGDEKDRDRLMEVLRQRDEAQATLEHQTACSTALGSELSELQAEVARLEHERSAAIARVRSNEGELAGMRRELEQKEAKLSRRNSSEISLKTANKELRDKLEQNESSLSEAVVQLTAANAEIERLSGSVRHRAGTLLVEATRRPGWKTLALPWRLARLRSDDRSDGSAS